MAVIFFLTFLAVSRHHAQAFWAVLLRVSKLNSGLNWLAGASILPDRPRAHVTSMCLGMARKQNGGYNASIPVQTPIFHLVVHPKTVRSAPWCCPNTTVALDCL